MGHIYNPGQQEAWSRVERRGAVDVESHVLLSVERGGRTRLSLTRIQPGGTFGPHIDDYEHVFCVQAGSGEAMVGKQRRRISSGDVIVTEVHEPHGLWADRDVPLVLLTANVYPTT